MQKDRLLFDLNPNPMLIYDPETLRILDINQAAIKKYGYSREEWSCLTLKDLLSADEISQPKKGGLNHSGIHRYKSKSGNIFYVKVTSHLYPTNDCEGARLVQTYDITSQIKAEEQARNLCEELQCHVENSPLGLIKCNSGFSIIEWSKRAEEISGYSKEVMIGQSPHELDFFGPDYIRLISRMKEKLIKGEAYDDEVETRIISKQGRRIDIKIHCSALWSNQAIKSILLFIEDITDQKRKERRIQNQNRLITFLQNLSIKVNNEQNYNEALYLALEEICSFLKWPVGHAYRRNKKGIFKSSGIWYTEHRINDEIEAFKKSTSLTPLKEDEGIFNQIMQRKEPLFIKNLSEFAFYMRDMVFDGITLRSILAFPILDKNDIMMVLEFYTDKPANIDEETVRFFSAIGRYLESVLKRIKTQKELKYSEHKSRNVFENTNDGVFIMKKNVFIDCNNQGTLLFECNKKDIIGKTPADFSPLTQFDGQKSSEKAAVKIKKALEGKPQVFEWKNLTASGKLVDVEVNLNRLQLSGSVYLQAIIRDLTEQKRTQQQLLDSLEEKNVLLSEIHHRVKNNLAIVSGLLELKAINSDNKELKTSLHESQLRIHSMALIHEKLYKYQTFSSIRLGDYIKQLVKAIKTTLGYAQKKINVQIESDDILLNINQAIPSALIINELVTNVFEHAFPDKNKGRLDVSLKQKKKVIELGVVDDGKGFTVDSTEAKFNTLGLTLVNQLTEQLNGELKICSNEKGTSFFITFEKADVRGSSSYHFV